MSTFLVFDFQNHADATAAYDKLKKFGLLEIDTASLNSLRLKTADDNFLSALSLDVAQSGAREDRKPLKAIIVNDGTSLCVVCYIEPIGTYQFEAGRILFRRPNQIIKGPPTPEFRPTEDVQVSVSPHVPPEPEPEPVITACRQTAPPPSPVAG